MGVRRHEKGRSKNEAGRNKEDLISKKKKGRRPLEERYEIAYGRRKKKEERVERQAVDNEKEKDESRIKRGRKEQGGRKEG